jgi:hypothetical protein
MLSTRAGVLFVTLAYFTFLTFFASSICFDGECILDSGGILPTDPDVANPLDQDVSSDGIKIFGVTIPGSAQLVTFVKTIIGFLTWAGDILGVFFDVFTLQMNVPTWFNLFFVTLPMFLMVGILISYLFELLGSLPIPFS